MQLPEAMLESVAGAAPLQRTSRSCADIGLDPDAAFDPFEPVGGRGLAAGTRFKTREAVDLSPTPNALRIAALVPNRKISEATTVLARTPGWARIGVSFEHVILAGWVPAASLGPAQKPPKESARSHRPSRILGLTTLMKRPIACDHDVDLIAEAGGQRRVVGTIGAGVAMETKPADAEVAAVRVYPIEASAGARFLVRRADVDGCAPTAP